MIHVLNTCSVACDDRRFNGQHDSLFREIVSIITTYLPSTACITSDLGEYSFPQHIVATDLRPDIVWWDDNVRSLYAVELTVPFETSFEKATERKIVKYEDMIQRARATGYVAELITLEVGSKGVINMSGSERERERERERESDQPWWLGGDAQ